MPTYLISGANRGIGKGILTGLLARPNTTVVAALRNIADSSAKDLSSIKPATGSKLIIVKVDALSATDASEAVELLKSKHGITKLDVVIANSGLLDQWGPVSQVKPQELRDHFEINTIAPIILFQAAFPLLEANENNPRFFVISSTISSFKLMPEIPLPTIAYGLSKSGANYAVAKIHYENPKISAVALHPGWVQTRMGKHAAELAGVTEIPVTIDESATGLLQQIDATTKDTLSGKFIAYDGNPVPW